MIFRNHLLMHLFWSFYVFESSKDTVFVIKKFLLQCFEKMFNTIGEHWGIDLDKLCINLANGKNVSQINSKLFYCSRLSFSIAENLLLRFQTVHCRLKFIANSIAFIDDTFLSLINKYSHIKSVGCFISSIISNKQ